MTIQELRPSKTENVQGQVLADGLSVNISDIFTRLIKDAVRCNSYSSDVYYDLQKIEETVRNYRNFAEVEPIFIGFRNYANNQRKKNGVFHSDFITGCGITVA